MAEPCDVCMSPSVTALALRVGAVGDGDVLIFSFVNFVRFENVNTIHIHVTCVYV